MKSIKKSVWIRILTILCAILISGGVTFTGLITIHNANRTFDLITVLHSTALESEKAHYIFLENISSAISLKTDYRPKDYQSCILGAFLYSDISIYESVYPEINSLVEEIKPLHREIHENANQILAIKDSDEEKALQIYSDVIKPDVTTMVQKLDAFVVSSQEILEEKSGELSNSIIITFFFTVLCTAVTLLASILLVRYIMPKVVDPLVEITRSSRKMALGDLDFEISIEQNQNEVGILADALNESVGQMRSYVTAIRRSMAKMVNGDLTIEKSMEFKGEFKIIQDSIMNFQSAIHDAFLQIRRTCEQVSSASQQVADGSQSLAQGSVKQAASIEDLATTLQNLTEQIKNNTESAGTAHRIALEVGDSMVASNEKMNEMTKAMDDIRAHSSQISNIIKAIEDISFQTNILALNAAVEASRAGTAGKGFAVVADEVRNLAAKSSRAAKNTSALIGDSIQSVANGVKIAQETASLLTVSMEGARNVSQTVEQISSESDRQYASVTEILNGINGISAIVQSNSATAEESAATSEELNGQASILHEMIARYRLSEEEADPASEQEPAGDERIIDSSESDKYSGIF